ncbi:tetratricopeptide repeat protein [Noviherbaspirillum sp. ST9]|uniref:tetratricopeptide repeat protein n=1 Tax=Noviherbaspirillum sp. ST9 TaxID=3401606 RepID=UPI003B585F14
MSLPSPSANIALHHALGHHQRGRLKEAEQLYRFVLKTHPGHVDAGRNLLASMLKGGRYAEMESAALELVKDAPRFGIAWKGMGVAQLMQGKDAVHAFRMAVQHLPDDAESLENLGLALKRAGQQEEAERCLRRAVMLNPASASACVNLGNLLRETGRVEEAAACFRRAIESRPDNADLHAQLAAVLQEQGSSDALPQGSSPDDAA